MQTVMPNSLVQRGDPLCPARRRHASAGSREYSAFVRRRETPGGEVAAGTGGRRRTSVLDSDLPAWGDEPSASTNRPGGSSMIEHVFDPRNLRYATRHQKIISGGSLGAECSQAGLVSASLRWREPVFSLLRPYTAITGIGWLAMVRRRSTVRFRKGTQPASQQLRSFFSKSVSI